MLTPRPPTQLLMACLGDASRFRLVEALLTGPRCVTDLAAEVGLSQSCTTRHLQALERRGVVAGARDGKRVLYRLCSERRDLGPLLAWALRADAGSATPRRGGPPGGRAAGEHRPASRSGRRRPGGKARSRPPARPRTVEPVRAPAPSANAEPAPVPVSPPPATPRPAEAPEPARVRRRAADIEDYLL